MGAVLHIAGACMHLLLAGIPVPIQQVHAVSE
jgi:hypothetical protein